MNQAFLGGSSNAEEAFGRQSIVDLDVHVDIDIDPMYAIASVASAGAALFLGLTAARDPSFVDTAKVVVPLNLVISVANAALAVNVQVCTPGQAGSYVNAGGSPEVVALEREVGLG
jgi:hypothetical protein